MQVLTSLRRLTVNMNVMLILRARHQTPGNSGTWQSDRCPIHLELHRLTQQSILVIYDSTIYTAEQYVSRRCTEERTQKAIAYYAVRSPLSGNELSRTPHCFFTWDYHHGKRFLSSNREPYHGISLSFFPPTHTLQRASCKHAIQVLPQNPTQKCIPTVITISISSSFVKLLTLLCISRSIHRNLE